MSRDDVALLEHAENEGADDPRECERGVSLRYGAWAEHWLNASGSVWISPLPQSLLVLDHRDNRAPDTLAKKVGLLAALSWGAKRDAKEQRLSVRALLQRTGELRRPGAAPDKHAGRLADRLDEALSRLSDRQILEGRLLADDARALRAAGRHWFTDWLEAEVVFAPPRFITDSAQRSRIR